MRAKALAAGKKFYAVVKADAYGHGAEEVARYIEDAVDGFCVAIIEEGITLRVAGVAKQILVFAPPSDGLDAARAAAYNLTVTVNGEGAARLVRGLNCHIKINTGMNRLGCGREELLKVLEILPADSVKGVYTHLYAPQDGAASARQLEIFLKAERAVKDVNSEACAHIAASGGLLRGGEYLSDAVRCGILLYGYAPIGFDGGGFERALKVYARRVQVTPFCGGGVGYNYADKDYATLSTYRCGYADGFLRNVPLGEKTLCMDAFISQRKEEMLCVMDDAESYASRCNTIPYEVLCGVTRRSGRVYER